MLRQPRAGGVILFSRNYESSDQLVALVDEIHGLREPRLLVAVDQEGGRVQRFREGFTRLPACSLLGELYASDQERGLRIAEEIGWLVAAELRAVGVDFSFAPVLDLRKGVSKVINDRAFHRGGEVVALLAHAYMKGMRSAGMGAVGKHFPGHGSVTEDSHHTLPVDSRRFEDIEMEDLVPFERLIHYGLPAIMAGHVIYPRVDDRPAGFSPIWLQHILRNQLGFQGAIFSDDIGMAAASVAGDFVQRAHSALNAGCDMVLICNNRQGTSEILDNLAVSPDPTSQVRLMRMHGRPAQDRLALRNDAKWQRISHEVDAIEQAPELNLGNDELF
ncbi:MAG: beta-N-acetylhexosaminidase [Gammaproteobacteria bacterium]|nr:beta-N-acetylhexosaminidase [Gammaproteobacteria bacterium]